MGKYYIGDMEFDSDYLAHYGVPGMKWGKHLFDSARRQASVAFGGRKFKQQMQTHKNYMDQHLSDIKGGNGSYAGYRAHENKYNMAKANYDKSLMGRAEKAGRKLRNAGYGIANEARKAGRSLSNVAKNARARLMSGGYGLGRRAAGLAGRIGSGARNAADSLFGGSKYKKQMEDHKYWMDRNKRYVDQTLNRDSRARSGNNVTSDYGNWKGSRAGYNAHKNAYDRSKAKYDRTIQGRIESLGNRVDNVVSSIKRKNSQRKQRAAARKQFRDINGRYGG